MGSVFLNNNRRLRSGWKITITFISFVVLTIITNLVFTLGYSAYLFSTGKVSLEYSGILAQYLQSRPILMVFILLQAANVTFAVLFYWKIWEKRSIRGLGLTNPFYHGKELGAGLVFGFISITIVFLVLYLIGQITITSSSIGPSIISILLVDFLLFSVVGFNEELFVRGYCITLLQESNRRWLIFVVPSLLFSLMHTLNPGLTMLALLNIFLVGILLAYMFLMTKNLWMPIGYHITWNYFQGSIFGFQVSGSEFGGILHIEQTGAAIINGGEFGPEGGLVTTVVIILGILFLIRKNRNNHLHYRNFPQNY